MVKYPPKNPRIRFVSPHTRERKTFWLDEKGKIINNKKAISPFIVIPNEVQKSEDLAQSPYDYNQGMQFIHDPEPFVLNQETQILEGFAQSQYVYGQEVGGLEKTESVKYLPNQELYVAGDSYDVNLENGFDDYGCDYNDIF